MRPEAEHRIGRLFCRFTAVGRAARMRADLSAAPHAADRLTASLGARLDRALGEQPTVYVVREVHATLTMHASGAVDPGVVADRVGEALADAVLQAIGDGEVLCFDDPADHLACFLTDLLAGNAGESWWHRSFAGARGPADADTALAVLLRDADQVPRVLALLHDRGALPGLLRTLGPARCARLRAYGLAGRPVPEPVVLRPLVETALRLVTALRLWASAPPDTEQVLADCLAAGLPAVPWGDTGAMADAVARIVELLDRQDRLHRHDPPGEVLDAALARLDWLDTARLRTRLTAPAAGHVVRAPAVARRRVELLHALAGVLAELAPTIDPSRRAAPETALLAYGALLSRFPQWSGDAVVRHHLDDLLELWSSIAAGGPPSRRAGRAAASLGPEGMAAAEAVAGRAPAAVPPVVWDTGCAGAFLLARAFTDTRMLDTARRLAVPAPGDQGVRALVRAVAGRLGEPDDPGLAVLSGHRPTPGEPAPPVLAEVWAAVPAADHDRLRAALRAIATGLRLADRWLDVTEDPADPAGTTATVATHVLLGQWSAWLRGFAGSTPGYLLDTFIRRPGRVRADGPDLVVRLAPRPIDPVLEVAGYLEPVTGDPALGFRRISFERGG